MDSKKNGLKMTLWGSLHNLANISYTGILNGDLGVHIGVYQPWYSVTLDQISPNPYHNYQEDLFLLILICYKIVTILLLLFKDKV